MDGDRQKFSRVWLRGWHLRVLAVLVVTLVVAHVTLVGLGLVSPSMAVFLLVVIESLTVGVVLARWRRTPAEAGLLWLMLGLAMLFQLLSGAFNLAATLIPGSAGTLILSLSWLLSGLYILPLMIMIARTFSREMTRMVHVLDGLLVVCTTTMLGALIYYIATTPPKVLALHGTEVAFLADSVNYTLAIMVTLRIVGSVTAMRRYAYLATSVFLWSHVLAVSVLNRVGQGPWPWPVYMLMDASLLVLLALTVAPIPAWLLRMRPSNRTIGVIDGFAPIVLTICVLALGISVSRLNFGVGMVVSVLSVLFYGLRMAYLYSRDHDRQRVVAQSNQRLQQRLGTDPLTGIANRLALDVRLPSLLDAARTSHSACSVLMIDIDYFKQYNDHFGHIAGDQCLQQVVEALGEGLLRTGDLISRYGGEEFVVVLPDTSERAAMMVAERLVASVSAQAIPHPQSPYERVTVSIGVANCTQCDAGQALALLDAADRALYRAKRQGRNGTSATVVEPSDMPMPMRAEQTFETARH